MPRSKEATSSKLFGCCAGDCVAKPASGCHAASGRRAAFDCLEPGAHRGLRRERSREDVRCHRHRSRTPSELSFAGTREEPQTQVQRPCQVRAVRWRIASTIEARLVSTKPHNRDQLPRPHQLNAPAALGETRSQRTQTDRSALDPTARYRVATRNCHSLQLPRCGGVQPLYPSSVSSVLRHGLGLAGMPVKAKA